MRPAADGGGRGLMAAGWRLVGAGAGVVVAAYARWGGWLFLLFLGGLLAYGGGFAGYLLSKFDLLNLLRDVNVDDSFYYFQIAWNMAQGKFSTFDGGITQTNGYHPLWLLLITPFYWFFDKETALFGIKAFEITLIAGGVALVAAAAYLARLPWLLLFAVLPALYSLRTIYLGTEAAAALLLLGLLFLGVVLFIRNPGRWKWPLAALLFALPWARLEYIAVSLAVAAVLLLIEWSRPGGGTATERPHLTGRGVLLRRLAGLYAVVPLLGAAAGLLVYFAYNLLVFGTYAPVSGQVKQAWSQQEWGYEGGYSLVGNFREITQIPIFDWELLVALEVGAYLLLVWWLARRSIKGRNGDGGGDNAYGGESGWLLLAFLVGAFGLAAGHLGKFAQTVLTTHPLHSSYDWYFIPAYLMMALIIPLRVYVAIYLIRRLAGGRWPRAARVLSVAAALAGLGWLAATTDFGEPFEFVDWRSETTAAHTNWGPWELGALAGTLLLNRALPDGSVIGSWDAGTLGYFSRFPVVNLDGLVNSYDYLQTARSDLSRYTYSSIEGHPLRQEFGLTHFANIMIDDIQHSLLEVSMPNLHKNRLFFFRVGAGESALGDVAGTLWRRMEPHFDWQADGVGLMVDGRLAQAVARDCAPDALFVWRYTHPEQGRIEQPGAGARRTAAGLCTDMVVLPHAAALYEPGSDAALGIQVELLPANEYLARLAESHYPLISSEFEVYLSHNTLIYAKAECTDKILNGWLFVHSHLLNPDTSIARTSGDGRWYILEYPFDAFGGNYGGICLAAIPLPNYELRRVNTGQYAASQYATGYGSERLWFGAITLDAGPLREAYAAARLVQPEALDGFEVYYADGALTYIKESCSPAELTADLFLHLRPVDADDLPEEYRAAGFHNLDFALGWHGMFLGGRCVALVPLPDYPIARINTGQTGLDGAYRWQTQIYADAAPLRAAYDAARAGEVAARSVFDLYISETGAGEFGAGESTDGETGGGETGGGTTLSYVKEPCAPGDIADGFYLHLIPANPEDLPEARRASGFENRDFIFNSYGTAAGRFGDKCVAAIPLPDYPLAAIRTGQAGPGGEPLWQANVYLDAAPLRAAYAAAVAGELLHRAAFDIYRNETPEGGAALSYVKEPCVHDDAGAVFFLHLIPANADDLPESRRESGFDNHDFRFSSYGGVFDGKCVAAVPLPDYPLARIRTGQYLPEEGRQLWAAEFGAGVN